MVSAKKNNIFRLFKKYFAKLDSEYLSKQIDNIYKAIDDVVNNITYNPKDILESFNNKQIVFDEYNDKSYYTIIKRLYKDYTHTNRLEIFNRHITYRYKIEDNNNNNSELEIDVYKSQSSLKLTHDADGITNKTYINNNDISVTESNQYNYVRSTLTNDNLSIEQKSKYDRTDIITEYANLGIDIYKQMSATDIYENTISLIALAQMLEAYYDSAAVADEEGNFKTYRERINDPNDPFYIGKTNIEEVMDEDKKD